MKNSRAQSADKTEKRVKYFTVWSIRELRKNSKNKDRAGWYCPDEKVLSKVDPAIKFPVVSTFLHGDGEFVRCTVYMSVEPEIRVLIDISVDDFNNLPTTPEVG